MAYSDSDIELAAREVLLRVWKDRVALGIDVGSPMQMYDPAVAAAALGVRVQYVESLGLVGPPGPRSEVAGLLNRSGRKILISTRFSPEVCRFTTAHEVAHFRLHRGEDLHRDRPTDLGFEAPWRSPIEREADRFAACLLMPAKAVRDAFELRFGSVPLRLTEEVAWNLGKGNADYVYESSTREIATMLATFHRPGRYPPSLAARFGVSAAAMAIRLEELGCVP